MKQYDKIIVGAGLYGLYSALFCAKQNDKVIVLEADEGPFQRATYINQARVHMGYHYPRSISTALKSKKYFDRFVQDFDFCILKEFDQIYATSAKHSWTNESQFRKFCRNADIRCDELAVNRYFKEGMCDGAFLTTEYTYDAHILRDYYVSELAKHTNVEIVYGVNITRITKGEDCYEVEYDSKNICAPFVLNATYSGVNYIQKLAGLEPFRIKYELCEIILCSVSDNFRDIGFTVMDGPFFSIMPFGKTGYHSLTSVSFTPHITSYDSVPRFPCQEKAGNLCLEHRLGNCDSCEFKPESAWAYMSSIAKKYLKEEYTFKYEKSLFSMKPILMASEIDDSRPTVIRIHSERPTFVSVLSGKINTVYDLDEVLKNDR
jgi:glycine/D-amino acid oxidase-like deaminating enzyme